ncbi:MAG: cation diffusion facilitator family transporter [Chitinophagales bacterium]|nr:cation transporter [Bacteroidota bacterium]MCB9043627.1 cation transporter [Chitinophagales bacterium]
MVINEQIKVQIWAVVIGVVLWLIKIWAYFLTFSNAILTDALEGIVNVVAGVFTLYSLIISAKPRDHDHPYGHGKIEFISAGFEGALIFTAGTLIFAKAIYNFWVPNQLQEIDAGLWLTVLAGGINFALGYYLLQKGRQQRSLPLEAGGKHLLTDAYTSLVLIVGLALIWITGYTIIDNILALALGAMIIYTGYKIMRSSIAGIMDEADKRLIDELIDVLQANRLEQWVDIHNLRVIKYGNTIHIDCHLTLPWYYSVEQAHHEVDNCGELVNAHGASNVELFIHVDPCLPQSCKICKLANCAERRYPFEQTLLWNFHNVTLNQRHSMHSLQE